jgi:aryl-alcohol dehydrogenase-like predicted oxidoreductase
MTTDQDTRQKITAELYAALERLGVDEELLAIVGSMNDTMTDKEVLRLLEEYNRSGKVMYQPE